MFSNFKNSTPPELSDDEIRDIETKLNRFFTPAEIHAIHNSTWLRNAVEFIKRRHSCGASISVIEPISRSDK